MTGKNLLKRSSHILVTIIIVAGFPVRTVGWGNRGHQVIARIAMARLSTSARQGIAELLQPGETLESVSTWADLKLEGDKTRSWHFVAIPVSDNRYSRVKDCAGAEICIIDAINQQITILKDTNQESNERAEALKFVVHLIGDLHQPFHVTTNLNPRDVGASRVRVISLSGRYTNLHDVWDSDLVEYGLKQTAESVGDYASQLSKKFSQSSSGQSDRRSFISTQGTATSWALEAHQLSWGAYYHTNGDFMVADSKRSWNLDQPYYVKNVPVVEGQLSRAGVRLAKILNDMFVARPSYKK